jgi:hypothetical protein
MPSIPDLARSSPDSPDSKLFSSESDERDINELRAAAPCLHGEKHQHSMDGRPDIMALDSSCLVRMCFDARKSPVSEPPAACDSENLPCDEPADLCELIVRTEPETEVCLPDPDEFRVSEDSSGVPASLLLRHCRKGMPGAAASCGSVEVPLPGAATISFLSRVAVEDLNSR